MRGAPPFAGDAGAAVHAHRLLGRARRRRSVRRGRSVAHGAALDWDATIAYRQRLWSLGLGVAEAMDTAQRGMGLDWPTSLELIRRSLDAGARPSRRARRLGLRHRPPRLRCVDDRRRRDPRLRRADGGDRSARRQAHRHGEPRAGARRDGPGRLRARLRPHPDAVEAAGDPALARRHVRSGAGRLLGQRRRRHGDGDGARRHRRQPGQGRRHQDLAARQGQGDRDAAGACPKACACTPATTSTTPS